MERSFILATSCRGQMCFFLPVLTMSLPVTLRRVSAEHPNASLGRMANLFLASVATLYFELLTIRYLSTEVRVFTNLKNLPLIASFFGIGVGIILGKPGKRLSAVFPLADWFFFRLFVVLPGCIFPTQMSPGRTICHKQRLRDRSGGSGTRYDLSSCSIWPVLVDCGSLCRTRRIRGGESEAYCRAQGLRD